MIKIFFVLFFFTGCALSVQCNGRSPSVDDVIKYLELEKHPQSSGYSKSIFVSKEKITPKNLSPGFKHDSYELHDAIYYLLPSHGLLKLHKMKSEKIQYFLLGSPVKLTIIHENGYLEQVILGKDIVHGEKLHHYVPGDTWFAIEPVDPNSEYSLIVCSVTPSWKTSDYIPGDKKLLLQKFPHLEEVITKLL